MGDDFYYYELFHNQMLFYTSARKDKKQWAAPNQY